MPKVAARDGTRLCLEEVGAGTSVAFVHEYAGDYRSWEPQMRFLCRQLKQKEPRGWAAFVRMLAEHSAEGHAQTMLNLQLKRPALWEMEPEVKRLSIPLLVIVGDEDDLRLDGSVFLKRTVPTAALLVIPRAGHTINSEAPAAVNSALAELFYAAEAGRWLAHKGNA
jgi:alpha-beta hydrolase superfamily lysophospholipase